jgi:signal transduction histidine kinase
MELQPCNATLVLEQVILRCETLPRENFQVHFAVPGDLILLANPRLLELLFFNLLRNAAEHASEPELTISIAENTLLFENSMAIEPPLEVTSTGTKSIDSQGIGQGLYLVARIIERFGWQLDVQTANKKFRVMVTPV